MRYINLSYKLIHCDFMAAAGSDPMNTGKSIGMMSFELGKFIFFGIMFILYTHKN